MSSYRDQNKIGGEEVRPIIVNVMSFNKAPPGEPVLLSFDDAKTLFHEFGHALHGLLSDVNYPLLWGTNVTRDFVELPSQLYEHWLERPEVLSRFARHAETGAPMPDALLKKVLAARTFNQGFATVEYTSSALVDLDLHEKGEVSDVVAEEKTELARIGMPEAIAMRHRTPHFQHIFAGEGYSAGYYGYLWSEVLDADAFERLRGGGRRVRSGGREAASRFHLRGGQPAGRGGRLQGISRADADDSGAFEEARTGRLGVERVHWGEVHGTQRSLYRRHADRFRCRASRCRSRPATR